MLANDVLPVDPSTTNLTYDLSFYGPAISCNEASQTEFNLAQKAMLEYQQTTGNRVFYYGWVPQSGWGPEVNGSFFASTDLQIGNVRLDTESSDAARLYIYLNTTGVDEKGKQVPLTKPSPAQLVTCALYNASYDTHFRVQSTGGQSISATTTFQNWMPAFASMNGLPSDPLVSEQMNMQSVMEAFGMMVIGPVEYSRNGSLPTTNSVYALGMNKEMFPARLGLDQTQMTQRVMSQNEALFRNITLSMRFGVIAG
jgi:hypothetical protein